MALTRRKNSKNWISQFSYNNKQYVKSTKTSNKKLAERIDKQYYENVINTVEFGENGSITLEEAVDMYLDRPKVNENRLYQDTMKTTRFLSVLNGKRKVHELKNYEVHNMIDVFMKQDLSNNYINSILSSLRMTIKTVKAKGYRTTTIDVQRLKVVKKRIRYLSYEEETLLLRDLNPVTRAELPNFKVRYTDSDVYDFAILSLDTGMRSGETLSLNWSNVDFKKRTLRVYRSKVDNESILYFTDRAESILRKRYVNRSTDNELIFNPTHPRLLQNRVIFSMNKLGFNNEELLKQHKGVHVNAHTLRKTFASRLVMNKVPIEVVSRILGHADIKMTQDAYAFLSPDMGTENAANVLNQLTQQNSQPNLMAV